MQYGNLSKHLERERASSGSISAGSRRPELTAQTKEADKFRQEFNQLVKDSKGLSNVKTSNRDIKWAVVQNTGYEVTHVKPGGFKALAAVVVDETSQSVLMSRKMLLRMKGWSELRTALWLATNEWLHWNTSGVDQRVFQYWDRIREQKVKEETWYGEAKIDRIHRLFTRDLDNLTRLGDILTTYPSLCNNPDEPAKKRVISLEAYQSIKALLDVGAGAHSIAEADSTAIQVSRRGADRQRRLTCPPDFEEPGNTMLNIPEYNFSQTVFRHFSDNEVQSQAGIEVLLATTVKEEVEPMDQNPASSYGDEVEEIKAKVRRSGDEEEEEPEPMDLDAEQKPSSSRERNLRFSGDESDEELEQMNLVMKQEPSSSKERNLWFWGDGEDEEPEQMSFVMKQEPSSSMEPNLWDPTPRPPDQRSGLGHELEDEVPIASWVSTPPPPHDSGPDGNSRKGLSKGYKAIDRETDTGNARPDRQVTAGNNQGPRTPSIDLFRATDSQNLDRGGRVDRESGLSSEIRQLGKDAVRMDLTNQGPAHHRSKRKKAGQRTSRSPTPSRSGNSEAQVDPVVRHHGTSIGRGSDAVGRSNRRPSPRILVPDSDQLDASEERKPTTQRTPGGVGAGSRLPVGTPALARASIERQARQTPPRAGSAMTTIKSLSKDKGKAKSRAPKLSFDPQPPPPNQLQNRVSSSIGEPENGSTDYDAMFLEEHGRVEAEKLQATSDRLQVVGEDEVGSTSGTKRARAESKTGVGQTTTNVTVERNSPPRKKGRVQGQGKPIGVDC